MSVNPASELFYLEIISVTHFPATSTECDICKSASTAPAPDLPHLSNISREDVVKLPPCGHIFHALCILSWFDVQIKQRRHGTCPLCRHVIFENLLVAENEEEESEGGGEDEAEVTVAELEDEIERSTRRLERIRQAMEEMWTPEELEEVERMMEEEGGGDGGGD